MTDREVEAIKQFLSQFGLIGCHKITWNCRSIMTLSEEEVAQKVLDLRQAWQREGLDVDRLYRVAVLANQYARYVSCLPGCCQPWGDIEPVLPPGPGGPLTMGQLNQAMLRAVPIRPRSEPTAD